MNFPLPSLQWSNSNRSSTNISTGASPSIRRYLRLGKTVSQWPKSLARPSLILLENEFFYPILIEYTDDRTIPNLLEVLKSLQNVLTIPNTILQSVIDKCMLEITTKRLPIFLQFQTIYHKFHYDQISMAMVLLGVLKSVTTMKKRKPALPWMHDLFARLPGADLLLKECDGQIRSIRPRGTLRVRTVHTRVRTIHAIHGPYFELDPGLRKESGHKKRQGPGQDPLQCFCKAYGNFFHKLHGSATVLIFQKKFEKSLSRIRAFIKKTHIFKSSYGA